MDNSIFTSIGLNIDIILLILVLIVLIQFTCLVIIFIKYSKMNKRLSRFLTGNDGKSLEQIMLKNFSHIKQIVNNEKKQNKNIETINDKFLTTFCKIGLIKYDAFKEMSGKLSFSLALLTENHDGIIITSMHSREGCFTYCKEISNEESYYILSEEERMALDLAIGKEGAKEKAKEIEEKQPEIGY